MNHTSPSQYESSVGYLTRHRYFLPALVVLLIIFAAGPATAFAQSIIYVDGDASGDNDGSSWTNAYFSLQSALAAAASGDEIWVAEGVYIPITPADPGNVTEAERNASFELTNGISVYGGFEGNEGNLNERDWNEHISILSGDIDGNDETFDPNTDNDGDENTPSQTDHIRGANSFNVVFGNGLDATTIIDGFTISSGSADEDFPNNSGGGFENLSGSPTLVNLVFSGNKAILGGGMANSVESDPQLSNILFYANSAGQTGGGMWTTGQQGVGIDPDKYSAPTLTNVTFSNNWSGETGGGMANASNGQVTLLNVAFSNNRAEGSGGGLHFNFSNGGFLTNLTFYGNHAGDGGGAISFFESTALVNNVIIWNNFANNDSTIMSSSILTFNLFGTSPPTFTNSNIANSGGSGDGWEDFMGTDNGGNIERDPRFVSTNPQRADFLHLSSKSPAINTGSNMAYTDTGGDLSEDIDLAGNPRVYDGASIEDVIDMGAYEYQGNPGLILQPDNNILYVNQDVNDSTPGYTGKGDSWENAVKELAVALQWAREEHGNGYGWNEEDPLQIWVAEGTYKPGYPGGAIPPGDPAPQRHNAFVMVPHVQVYGGFAGDEPGLNERNATQIHTDNQVTLSGDLGNENDNSDNAYHVVISAGDVGSALLDGVTVTGGHANGTVPVSVYGEAIQGFDGGGIYNANSSGSFRNLVVTDNTVVQHGGGILTKNIGSPEFVNVNLTGNSAGLGGGMANTGSSPTLIHATLAGNIAETGGGIFNTNNGLEVINSIVWGNTADEGTGEIFTNADLILSYSLAGENGCSSIVNDGGSLTCDDADVLGGDPQFTDVDNGDYILLATSPAINAGDNDAIPSGLATDLAGNARIFDGAPDPDVVDMGAYEFQGEPQVDQDLTLTVDEGWRMLSSPVEGQSYADMLNPLWTQGVPGSDYEGDETTFPNVYTWNTGYDGDCVTEYDNNQECDGWQPPISAVFGDPIPAGSGFLVYVFEDDDFDGTIDPDSEEFDKTITLSGPTHAGDVSPAINTNPEGWTLVGNPYKRPVAFNELERTDVKDVAYVYDPNLDLSPDDQGPVNGNGGAWRSITGLYGDIPSGNIAPGQGFFVQTAETPAGTPALTFSESDQTGGGEFYGKESEPRDYVRLEVRGESLYNSAWVRFSEEGSVEQTDGEALELQPLSADYAMLAARKADGTLMDIAHYPLNEQELEIPLALQATQSGQFTIRATDLDLPAGMSLYLYDRETGESMLIGEDFEYSFELNIGKGAKKSPLERGKALNNSEADCAERGVCPSVPQPIQPSDRSLRHQGSGGQVKRSDGSVANTDRFLITTTPGGPASELPNEVALGQNYPNPFNPATVISYQLPQQSQVRLEVYDMLGRNVATLVDGQVAAGRHQVNFDASNLSSGVYLYQLQTGSNIITKKLTLIK